MSLECRKLAARGAFVFRAISCGRLARVTCLRRAMQNRCAFSGRPFASRFGMLKQRKDAGRVRLPVSVFQRCAAIGYSGTSNDRSPNAVCSRTFRSGPCFSGSPPNASPRSRTECRPSSKRSRAPKYHRVLAMPFASSSDAASFLRRSVPAGCRQQTKPIRKESLPNSERHKLSCAFKIKKTSPPACSTS